jgi:hypothetical protein
VLKTAAETLITIAPSAQSPWAEGPRPQASRRPHRAHRRLAQLGIGTDPPSDTPIITPGGGFSPEPTPAQAGGQHWIPGRPGFFLPVRVLSRLFRCLFLEQLTEPTKPGG